LSPRLVKIGIAFLAVCIVTAAGGYLYLRWQLGKINRLALPGLSDEGEVMNVLLVGSDSRARVTGDLAESTGKEQVTGQRSDTIMVLHVDPRQKKAAIFSIPRDLYVPIAGEKFSDRVNAAFSLHGAQGLIDTLEAALEIPINHYVEVDFVGFRDIVEAVGGVNVYVPAPVRDTVSGLSIENPGCVRLDGDQGLAFVRSRYYETLESGKWQVDPTADLGRIQRQQDFIRRMLRKAVSSGLTNPIKLNRLIGIGVRDVTLDDKMTTTDIVNLAKRFRSLDPDTVDMLTFPTTPKTISGKSVLLLKDAEAKPYIDRLNGILPPEPPPPDAVRPEDVRIRVLNGYGGEGAAGKASTDLIGVGFNIADRGDADTYNYPHTVIRHAKGNRAAADLLQRHLKTAATIQEDTSLRTVDLTLVLGSDYTGVQAQPGPASQGQATPTTAASTDGTQPAQGAAAGPSC
jgi:polyisoprenyl-teichoic acid--peptidoglycan teichoic acid transferase